MNARISVYHRSSDPYAYVHTDGSLHLRLKAGKFEVKEVDVLFSDPYKWLLVTCPMSVREFDDSFNYWFVSLKPRYNRLRYCFRIYDFDDSYIYCENEVMKDPPTKADPCFCYPYVRYEDSIYIPEWFRKSVFYQIFPDRFCRYAPDHDDEKIIPWNSEEPTTTSFFGGNIAGIINKLDYLKELGIDAVYLNPIFTAETNHRYDTINYFEVDPLLGNNDSLKALIDECHKRKIRLILDGVFNHCSHNHPFFQDAYENKSSIYRNWFIFHPEDAANEYEMFAFERYLPKLNTQNPDVQDYLISVALHWIQNFDIDGWRLDVINEISRDFCRRLRKEIQAVKPEAVLLGEIWHDALPWLSNAELHTVTNYRLREILLDFFVHNKTTPLDFAHSFYHLTASYPLSFCLFNLLGSHDTARIFTLCENSIHRLKLLFLVLFSFPGTPCIYYGDEIGLPGGEDPLCRACMPWNEFSVEQNELFDFVCELIRWRHECEEFRSDEIDFVPASDFILAYVKAEYVIFIINPCDNTATFQIPLSFRNFKIVLSSRLLVDKRTISMNPYDYFVLMKQDGRIRKRQFNHIEGEQPLESLCCTDAISKSKVDE